jgi:hypothetical protein
MEQVRVDYIMKGLEGHRLGKAAMARALASIAPVAEAGECSAQALPGPG